MRCSRKSDATSGDHACTGHDSRVDVNTPDRHEEGVSIQRIAEICNICALQLGSDRHVAGTRHLTGESDDPRNRSNDIDARRNRKVERSVSRTVRTRRGDEVLHDRRRHGRAQT